MSMTEREKMLAGLNTMPGIRSYQRLGKLQRELPES